MKAVVRLMNSFWDWAECTYSWKKHDISTMPFDPICFPQFEEMRSLCISLINCPLSDEEIKAFLLCMAMDSEDECILDACKEQANNDFLYMILVVGVSFPEYETRWQMAELLRNHIPNRQSFLDVLLHDPNPYVRKRACNVARQF